MSVPLRQQIAVGSYLIKQKIKGVKKYPLVLMLEPLFKCNLACAGCGKIDYPDDILDKRLSVEECFLLSTEGWPFVLVKNCCNISLIIDCLLVFCKEMLLFGKSSWYFKE